MSEVQSMKMKKLKPEGGELSRYAVLIGGELVGHLAARETTKTGFRNNRCIGQVRCQRWHPTTASGERIGEPRRFMLVPDGHATRTQAAQALVEAWRKASAATQD